MEKMIEMIKEKTKQKNIEQMLEKVLHKVEEKQKANNENKINKISNDILLIENKILNSLQKEFKNKMSTILVGMLDKKELKTIIAHLTRSEQHFLAILTSLAIEAESLIASVNRAEMTGKDKELNSIFTNCETFYKKLSNKLKKKGA